MISKRFYLSLLSLVLLFAACKKEELARYDYKTLGSSAHDLLSSSSYSALAIEIDYAPGYAPSATALSNLASFLNDHINKPGGIHISQKEIPSNGNSTLSLDSIVAIEHSYRTLFTGDHTVAVHILITDAADPILFAFSYWNTSICLFGKNIYNSSGGVGQVSRTDLMTALLEHEFGHLLGLVDQGSPMQTPHRDAAHGPHCNNPSCLMYYEVETIANSSVSVLDTNCLLDLKANGGR